MSRGARLQSAERNSSARPQRAQWLDRVPLHLAGEGLRQRLAQDRGMLVGAESGRGLGRPSAPLPGPRSGAPRGPSRPSVPHVDSRLVFEGGRAFRQDAGEIDHGARRGSAHMRRARSKACWGTFTNRRRRRTSGRGRGSAAAACRAGSAGCRASRTSVGRGAALAADFGERGDFVGEGEDQFGGGPHLSARFHKSV